MELSGYCSIGAPWKCLMGNTWGMHRWGLLIGASMELCFWVMHWGLHGLALGLLIGNAM